MDELLFGSVRLPDVETIGTGRTYSTFVQEPLYRGSSVDLVLLIEHPIESDAEYDAGGLVKRWLANTPGLLSDTSSRILVTDQEQERIAYHSTLVSRSHCSGYWQKLPWHERGQCAFTKHCLLSALHSLTACRSSLC